MWVFMPDAGYSIRPYDPDKGGRPVEEPHVVVRARIEADIEKVRQRTTGWFDLPHGSDYRYHLAVPTREWARYLGELAAEIHTRGEMKAYDNPRHDVHLAVWNAAYALGDLDGDLMQEQA